MEGRSQVNYFSSICRLFKEIFCEQRKVGSILRAPFFLTVGALLHGASPTPVRVRLVAIGTHHRCGNRSGTSTTKPGQHHCSLAGTRGNEELHLYLCQIGHFVIGFPTPRP